MSSAESNYPRQSAPSHEEQTTDQFATDGAERAAASAEERLLELIIQETEKLLLSSPEEKKEDGAADAADMGAIRALAKRRRGESFALDPIVTEITAALLEKTFRQHVASSEEWTALTARIAHTLYDDPAARERMRAMWQRLAGGAPP